ncbi:MAG TPA: LamG-like jellyroll fold domain-containing protein, partial [Pirellulales bacterium]
MQQLERRLVLTAQDLDLVTLIKNDIQQGVSGTVSPSGDLTVSSQGNVLLTLDSPTLTFNGSSTVAITAASASLFTNQSDFTATVTSFSGSYDNTSGEMSLAAASAEVKVGDILDLNANEPSFTLSSAGALTFTDQSTTASSPRFAGTTTSTVTGLDITESGISFSDANVKVSSITLDSVLQVTNFDLDVPGFSYSTSDGFKIASASISADSASLFPNQKDFTATVKNFGGSYDFGSGKLTLQAGELDIAVSDVLEIDATKLSFQLDPFRVTIVSATASSKRFDVIGGSVKGLSITSDGFSFDDVTLGANGNVNLGKVFSFTNLQVSLTNFGYSISNGAAFGVFDSTTNTFNDSILGVKADSATLNIGSELNASATGISGAVDLSSNNLGAFMFQAATVTIGVGTYLELDATTIDFNPGATQGDIADFGSATAKLNIAGLTFSGTAQDFGISNGGDFVAQPGFGVSFTVGGSSSGAVSSDTVASAIQWPSWLPIQIQQLALAWPDFNDDPQDFTIDLSASVHVAGLGGSGVNLDGYVDNAVLDTGLLSQGKFPLIGLSGVGIEASGNLFGAQIQGEFFLSMLRYDAGGNVIADDDNTTPVAKSYLYGGIDAGIEIAGEAGFQIRLGVSQLGPLEGYVRVSDPVILDPIFTGLALTDFSAGIQFDSHMPDLTDARQMATEADFVSSSQLSLNQWKGLLESAMTTQVAAQGNSNSVADDFLDVLNSPMTMEGGVTIFSAFSSGDSFKIPCTFKFDTLGHFYAQGRLQLGGTFNMPVDLYFNASQLAQGEGSIYVLAQGPQKTPIFTLYGGLNLDFGNLLDTLKKEVSGAGPLGPQLGTAIQLNGADQYATAPDINLNNRSFTTEFWAQRQDSGRAETVLAENNGIQIGFDATNDLSFSYGGSTIVSYVKPDNLWHDYAVSYDDTTGAVVLYVDGAEVEQGTISPSSVAAADNTLYMGSMPGGGGYFNGALDEVRIWNTVRSSSDIVSNMDTPIVDPDALKQLLGYWQFEDGDGTTASDSSLNGNTAQLVGNPQWIEADANHVSFTAGSFTLKIEGGLDLTAPSLGDVHVTGLASITVVPQTDTNPPTIPSIVMNITGTLGIDPLGDLLDVNGSVHLEFDTETDSSGGQSLVPNLWGAFELQPEDLTILKKAGLEVSGSSLLRFNTDTADHNISVQDYPAKGESTSVDLPATSLQFYYDGSAEFQRGGDWFDMTGTIIAGFVVTGSATQTFTDANGNSFQVTTDTFKLDTLIDGTLAVGPAANPLGTFTVDGFMQIDDTGIAALIDATWAGSGSLTTNGVDLNASFYLELNTTGNEVTYTVPSGFPVPKEVKNGAVDIPAAPTDVNDNAGAPGPYLIAYGNGDVTLEHGFDLHGNFDLQIGAAGLTADFNSQVTVLGLGILDAKGSLAADSAGVTGDLSIVTPNLNAGTGFSLSGSFAMEVNTTNAPVTVGPENAPLAAGQVLIVAAGDLNAGGLDLKGAFILSLNSNALNVAADGKVAIGPLGTLDFNSALTISSDGVYGDLALNNPALGTPPLAGNDFTISGTADLQINTTDSAQDGLAADTVKVHVLGDAQLQTTLAEATSDSFQIQGAFDLAVQPNDLQVAVMGAVEVGPLGTLSVSGDLNANSDGIWGDLLVGQSALPHTYGFNVNGEMQLEVNTTNGPQTVLARPINVASGAVGAPLNVTLAPYSVELAIGGSVSFLNSFTLNGELDVTLAAGDLNATINASVSVFNITATVAGDVTVNSDASVCGTLTVTAGGSDDLSFASDTFTIAAQADFTFDTQNKTAEFNLYGANGGLATVSFFGMTASGDLTVDYTGGVTTISVPDISISVPDPIQRAGAGVWKNFFGNTGPFDPNAAITVDASGFFQSDGQFMLTVGGNLDIGSGSFESGVGALGGYVIQIGNFTGNYATGFNVDYSGGSNGNQTYVPTLTSTYGTFTGFSAQVWAVGWVQYVGFGLMTGGVEASQGYFDMHLWAAAHAGDLVPWAQSKNWLPGINWDYKIGSLSSPPPPVPVIYSFSPSGGFSPNGQPYVYARQNELVQPFVAAYALSETDNGSGYTIAEVPVSYSEAIYFDGNLISNGRTFIPKVPGTYEVVVTATAQNGLSTSQTGDLIVQDRPPTNASFSMPSTALIGQDVTTSNVTYDNWVGNSENISWTVTQHGTLVATGVGANFTFRPEIAGTYVVAAVVSDDFGGSTQVGRTLTVVNPSAELAFYNDGSVNEGSPITVGFSGIATTPGTTYSFDFQDDGSFTDPGDVANSSSPTASYTFTQPGTYTIHARATAPGGASTDYYTTVTIAAPAVLIQVDGIQGTEGATAGEVTVATFTDP